jgi:hypothetical protein
MSTLPSRITLSLNNVPGRKVSTTIQNIRIGRFVSINEDHVKGAGIFYQTGSSSIRPTGFQFCRKTGPGNVFLRDIRMVRVHSRKDTTGFRNRFSQRWTDRPPGFPIPGFFWLTVSQAGTKISQVGGHSGVYLPLYGTTQQREGFIFRIEQFTCIGQLL